VDSVKSKREAPFLVRQATQAGAAVLILVAALHAGAAAAHGKVSLEEDSCVRRIGESMVHLSAYQPQFEPTCPSACV